MMERKYIIVTGGVLSGLGKGIAAASIGNLLSDNLNVIPVKCDGYLNVDPGTMNPIEHGEVFVLDDGGEVDMDFGHYERFLSVTCRSEWNLTMGKVFEKVRNKERRGDYLGSTVQFIPHVTSMIRQWWYDIAEKEDAEVLLIEVGGTVGDMENELYIEAVRQLQQDVGRENVLYVHLTYVPIPSGVNEQKSKPTQQTVNLLMQRGVLPDIIIPRCSEYLTDAVRKKISRFCNVDLESVITSVDVDTIYKIPMVFERQNMVPLLAKKLGLVVNPRNQRWKELVSKIKKGEDITIAVCGKYTALEDSYASIMEALVHSGCNHNCNVNLTWIETSEEHDLKGALKGAHGVIVPGGFGSRGVEGKINVVRYCRENKIPFLGICYGLQMAVIEYARNVCGLEDANTTEVNKDTSHPVVDILPEQEGIIDKGGTMRLGAYPAELLPGSKVQCLYGSDSASERHRHRYEVNPEYHNILEDKGMVFSGISPDKKLVEFLELPDHPYFVATQAHPELKSSLLKPAPLFYGLVKAAKEYKARDVGVSCTPSQDLA